jgi:hypothetical protein
MSVANGTGNGKGPHQTYLEFQQAGEFKIQHCGTCGAHVFYPRVACPQCGSPRLSWVSTCGLGTVYSTTVVRRRPEAGGDLNVALIDLDEGVRMMSRVDGIEPEHVQIGMRVESMITSTPAGPLVVFVPAKAQS